MKDLRKRYSWVTQKKLFWFHFEFPIEISSQGRETKPQGPNGMSAAALPFQASRGLLLQ